MILQRSHKLIAFLFSGQGAQKVGMLKEACATNPKIAEMLNHSKSILKYNLLDICSNGPQEQLNKTEICQPALFLAGLAAVEVASQNQQIINCNAVAGLSLGEYTALVHAKAMSFDDALKLVKARGEAMQRASEAAQSAMTSVVGCNDEAIISLINEITSSTKGQLQIANYLGPQHRALSGDLTSIIEVESKAKKSIKARLAKRIPVSGAFHSPFMKPALDSLSREIEKVKFYKPIIPVIANVDGKPHTDPDEIKSLLLNQLTCPVRWEESMNYLLEAGYTGFYEMGTGATLTGLMKNTVSSSTSPQVDKGNVEVISVSV